MALKKPIWICQTQHLSQQQFQHAKTTTKHQKPRPRNVFQTRGHSVERFLYTHAHIPYEHLMQELVPASGTKASRYNIILERELVKHVSNWTRTCHRSNINYYLYSWCPYVFHWCISKGSRGFHFFGQLNIMFYNNILYTYTHTHTYVSSLISLRFLCMPHLSVKCQ